MPKFQVMIFPNAMTYVVDAEDKNEASEKAYEYAMKVGLYDVLRRAELEVELFDA
jgi:hypothetical protein